MRALLLLIVVAPGLLADGGALLSRQQAGPFLVTVFAAPAPLHAGPVDTSVLVQDRETQKSILDATVVVQLKQAGANLKEAALRDRAQNKLLYAASFDLKDPGEWRYAIDVSRAGSTGLVSGSFILPPAASKLGGSWSYFAFPPAAIVLFGFHQWLKSRRLRANPHEFLAIDRRHR